MGHSHAHNHDPGGVHTHSHAYGHAHAHAPTDFGRAFAVGVVLNSVFVVVEATYGFLSGSMALVADAGHNLSDVLALLLAWGASIAAKRPPSGRFTYGFKSSTILAALINALLLALAIGAILFETVHRMIDPAPVEGMTMVVVASIGIVINTVTALMFLSGSKHDLNIRGAFLHMAADALVSLGVVIAGAGILITGWLWIDPITSLLIVAIIGWGTWGLAKESVRMGLLAVPQDIDELAVREFLAGLDGVTSVDDLHIWPMSTTETALTAHLRMPDGHSSDAFLSAAADALASEFGIGHTTLQVSEGPIARGCK